MSWRGKNGAQVEKIREWRIYQLVNILFFFTCIISIFPNLDYKRAFCLAGETGNEGRGRTWHSYCYRERKWEISWAVGVTIYLSGLWPVVSKICKWYKYCHHVQFLTESSTFVCSISLKVFCWNEQNKLKELSKVIKSCQNSHRIIALLIRQW